MSNRQFFMILVGILLISIPLLIKLRSSRTELEPLAAMTPFVAPVTAPSSTEIDGTVLVSTDVSTKPVVNAETSPLLTTGLEASSKPVLQLPTAAESDAAKKRFQTEVGLAVPFPEEFLFSLYTEPEMDGKLQYLQGIDPKTGNRILAYGLKGTATDEQIAEYVAETSGLSPEAIQEAEADTDAVVKFGSDSGLADGRAYTSTDPVRKKSVKAVMMKSASGDRTYLLGLVSNPNYFTSNEDRFEKILSEIKVLK